MEPDEVEAWVNEVVAALRPSLLVHARSGEFNIVAPPPEEVAERIAEDVFARVRASQDAETGRGGPAEAAGT